MRRPRQKRTTLRRGEVLWAAKRGATRRPPTSTLKHLDFSVDDLADIDTYAVEGDIGIWRGPATS
jgi:L-glyceraldehyde 3-phosphate reductase